MEVAIPLLCLPQTHLQASHAAELAAVEQRYTTVSRHIGLGHRQAQQVQEVGSLWHLYNVELCGCRKRADFMN